MVRSLKIAAAAGCALALSSVPVFAQDLDLDPFHIFTPAPPPPAAAPVEAGHHWHHRHWHHHHWAHAHHHAHKH